jgi:fructokinase
LPTGTVSVTIEEGEPHYTIHEPVAWDRLQYTREWAALAEGADAVCFGTLAQRDPVSRQAIIDFLDATRSSCVRVFDANLRSPFWSAEALPGSMARATILKLNAAELPLVLEATGACPHPPAEHDHNETLLGARRLLERYPLRMVCVTLGAGGSLLVTRDDFHLHRGYAVRVRDTVGAGDAFTAALTHYYLREEPLAALNEAGNRWGSWMASQSGAMPPLSAATVAETAEAIEATAAVSG